MSKDEQTQEKKLLEKRLKNKIEEYETMFERVSSIH